MTAGRPSYRLPQAKWTLEFSAAALETIAAHVQHGRMSKESVGQLFSKDLTGDQLVVDIATRLTPTVATRTRVRFDTERAMYERRVLVEQGLHCIGLWHTHPEPMPAPSGEDLLLAREHALAAQPQLSGLVFAIAGTLPFPSGLRVWVDDGRQLRLAEAVRQTVATNRKQLDL